MKRILFFVLSICTSMQLSSQVQRPPITPAWAFGHIVWEDSLNNRNAVEHLVEAYLEHDIPVDATIIDSPWTLSYNDFNWDGGRYPNSQQMIDGLYSRGVRTILWLTGNVNDRDLEGDTPVGHNAMLTYVQQKGYAVNDGEIYHWWKGDGAHIDFTNPKARRWWYKQLDKVFSHGVYGWKVDQGESWLDKDVRTSIGTIPLEQFSPYYYDAMFDYTASRRDAGIAIARPYSHQGGYLASVGKCNMGWCGDFDGTWQGLKLQLDNIYRSAQSGYGALAMEVAGFYRGRSSTEEFVRYIQAGCMMACIINGGENGALTNHLPWWHGDEANQVYHYCVWLHRQLSPYMFSSVVDAHLHGGSLLHNTSLEELSHQLGTDIFTKPITSSDSLVDYRLPAEGEWIDFWDHSRHAAGERLTRHFPIAQFPLYLRAGAIIPLRIENDATGIGNSSMRGKEVFLIVPKGKSERTLHLPKGEGTDYFDCHITYDESTRAIEIRSDRKLDAVFIVPDVGEVSFSGKRGTLVL